MELKKSDQTKDAILNAAIIEFCGKGLAGARIDSIASIANINKRMIYEYFGNKENLYKVVLNAVYNRLSHIENNIINQEGDFNTKLFKLISEYMFFLKNNPEYVKIIMWENLNEGIYFLDLQLGEIKNPIQKELSKIVSQGIQDGIFKKNIDSQQLFLNLISLTFNYFSNLYTLKNVLQKELESDEEINKRILIIHETILSYIKI